MGRDLLDEWPLRVEELPITPLCAADARVVPVLDEWSFMKELLALKDVLLFTAGGLPAAPKVPAPAPYEPATLRL